MLERVLEPEFMDSVEDAHQYDAMNHVAVNTSFVTDLLAVLNVRRPAIVLDLGAGTAQIPIELCRQAPNVRVVAVDAADSMLTIAEQNVAAAGLSDRIELVLADAKQLPFLDASFPIVISNSIVHHIGEPRAFVAEAVRVTAGSGLLFHRDLGRPVDEVTLQRLVDTYASAANNYQRRLFSESLHAALSIAEMSHLVAEFGIDPASITMTSDRHWTWISERP